MSSRKRMISASGALGVLGASVLSASGTGIGAGVLGASGTGISTTPSTTNNASLALLWGATGEQEWTPALTTG